jgi:hypothetical protein
LISSTRFGPIHVCNNHPASAAHQERDSDIEQQQLTLGFLILFHEVPHDILDGCNHVFGADYEIEDGVYYVNFQDSKSFDERNRPVDFQVAVGSQAIIQWDTPESRAGTWLIRLGRIVCGDGSDAQGIEE